MISSHGLPVVALGSVAPGRLVADGDDLRWEGTPTWATTHGEHAKAVYCAGILIGVDGARLPDGSRTGRISEGNPEVAGQWRLDVGDDRWIPGTLNITEDDIQFVQGPIDVIDAERFRSGTLPSDMIGSAEFMTRFDDFGFSCDLYNALCHNRWERANGEPYNAPAHRNAQLVADMRGRGETRNDFLENGEEGFVTDEVAEALGAIGWTLAGAVDRTAIGRRGETIARKCLARTDVGQAPGWLAPWAFALVNSITDNGLRARMYRAAAAGRVSLVEWENFIEAYDDIPMQ